MIASINSAVQSSFIGRFFKLEERKTTFFTELNGAVSTFMSLAYILAVNPRILADSGGPCEAPDGNIFAPEYEECLQDITKEYITATAIASTIGCLLMGLLGNLPIAIAPGMGLNAYFTYSVVGWRGTGKLSYEAATTAVAIEGAIFFLLSITGIRFAIIRLIPEPIKHATPAAIGAFLAHLGLQTAEGIGVVVSDTATAVTLGGCAEDRRTYITSLTDACINDGMCLKGDAYTCDDNGGIMESPTTWLGIFGLAVIALLLAYKNRGAFIIGIGVVTIVSWFRNTDVTYFPDNDAGDAKFEYFKQVVSVESLDKIMVPFTSKLDGEVWLALFTFFYVDFLDTSGTLLALTSAMGVTDPETGDFERSNLAFAADAIATVVGSFFGLSPLTSYIESGAGVEAGAKTGLTAVFMAFFFFLSIFFAPILANIPPWAIGGSLIIIGCLMCRSLEKIKWENPSHAISAFITVIMMPLTYSIAYGLIAGIGIYVIVEGVCLVLSLVGIKRPEYGDSTKEESKEAAAQPSKDADKISDEAVEKETPIVEVDPDLEAEA